MFVTMYRTIVFLWPFIKGVVLGEKSVKEAVKDHKIRVVGIVVIVLAIAMHFFLIPKLIKISADYLELEKKYNTVAERDRLAQAAIDAGDFQKETIRKLNAERDRLMAELKTCTVNGPVLGKSDQLTPKKPEVSKPAGPGSLYDRYSNYGDFFDKLQNGNDL
jgi:hypothetical protein